MSLKRDALADLTNVEKDQILTLIKDFSDVLRLSNDFASTSTMERLLDTDSASFYSPFDTGAGAFGRAASVRNPFELISTWCNDRIGTPDYRDKLIERVFGSSFLHLTQYGNHRGCVDIIRTQIRDIAVTVERDLKRARQDNEYLTYEARQSVRQIMTMDLGWFTTGLWIHGLDEKLGSLRRLEDFNIRVIDLDCTGTGYPVEVKLTWENGQNILDILVKVRFNGEGMDERLDGYTAEFTSFPDYPARVTAENSRRKAVLVGFERWSGVYEGGRTTRGGSLQGGGKPGGLFGGD